MRSKRPILLLEDDDIDAATVRRALKDARVTNRLLRASNGEEGLALLREGQEKPCLVLLDLNMPRMDGFEFLKAVRESEALKTLPVIVLTTSKNDSDRVESFGLGVAGYMVKPVDYGQFVDVVRTIDLYWTLSELPD